jgi:drug/metabolite transporter (DMT)-like permease
MSETHAAASPAANRRGMIVLTLGMASYTVNDTFVKLIARELPFGEVIFLRGVLSVLVLTVALMIVVDLRSLVTAFNPKVLWRALFDALSTAFFVAALVHMKIAELSAVVLTSPLILTALAAFAFRTRVGWRSWSAIGVGLLGTLFIVKPSAGTFDIWAIVGLAAAVFSAFRDLATRSISHTIPTLAVSVYGAFAVMLTGAALGVAESWVMPDLWQWAGVAIAALFLGLGTFLIVLGFRNVDIPVVAPFRYTLLLWMGISGYFAFGEVPDRWSWVGAALIALSGLYALYRESVRKRELAATALPPA